MTETTVATVQEWSVVMQIASNAQLLAGRRSANGLLHRVCVLDNIMKRETKAEKRAQGTEHSSCGVLGSLAKLAEPEANPYCPRL